MGDAKTARQPHFDHYFFMQAYEMFSKMSPQLSESILRWFRESERAIYRTAAVSLAQQKKLRAEYITRKSVPEQIQWVLLQLRVKANEAVGENMLQIWLMKGRSEMLVTFCDAVGIKHDGKGGVDGDLPSTLEAGKVRAGVDALLAKFPAEETAVYLHLFQLQQPGGWPTIAEILASEPRLALS
jgi:hypothetical protein